jgi:hypothetical protein
VSLDVIDSSLVHAMFLDEDSDNASIDDNSISQSTRDNYQNSFNGNTITCRVTVSQDRAHLYLNSVLVKHHQHITILDSGADTTIIGKGWLIETTHPTRTANAQGFDVNQAIKRGLPIVSAISAVDHPDDHVILIRVAEAIYKNSSHHSLLSEFQIRDYGVKANTIARKHGGRQCLGIPIAQNSTDLASIEYILSVLSRCLCNFGNRVPTTHEIHSFPLYQLTQDQVPWNSAGFYDDPSLNFVTNQAFWIKQDSDNTKPKTKSMSDDVSTLIHPKLVTVTC